MKLRWNILLINVLKLKEEDPTIYIEHQGSLDIFPGKLLILMIYNQYLWGWNLTSTFSQSYLNKYNCYEIIKNEWYPLLF